MTDPVTAPTRGERLVVLAVTATFGVILVLWAALVPTFEAPDERAHFDAAVHVAIGDGWPDPGDLHLLQAVDGAGAGTTASMGRCSTPRVLPRSTPSTR